jgi:hypothetical protein
LNKLENFTNVLNLDYLDPNPDFCKYPGLIQCQHLYLTDHPSSIEFSLNGSYNIPVLVPPLPNPRTGVRFMGWFLYPPCVVVPISGVDEKFG